MPTYEFRCPDGHNFEHFYRKISDGQLEVACPECGKLATRQMSAGAGLMFKGSGFYLTDYGKNAHRKSDGADKAAKTDSSNGDGKAAESKPAEAKAESSSKNTNTGDAKPAGAPPSSSSSSSGSSEKK